MGKKTRSVLLVVVLLGLGRDPLLARQTAATSEKPMLTPAGRWQSIDIFVYLRQGGIVTGPLMGLEDQAVVLSTPQGRRVIPLADIARIVFKADEKSASVIVSGMLVGMYAGNLLLRHEAGKPFGYTMPFGAPLGVLLSNVMFAAAGGGLFALVGASGGEKEVRFDFSAGETASLATWERLRQMVSDVPPGPGIHLDVMGGLIMAESIGRYSRTLEGAGYTLGTYSPEHHPGGSSDESTGNFNLLRKIQLTFNIGRALEVGLAFTPLSEPYAIAGKYQETSAGDQVFYRSFHAGQTLAAVGAYAVAVYKPFPGRLPRALSWSLGLGLGAARVAYHLNILLESSTYQNGRYVSSERHESVFDLVKVRPSGVAFTQFEWFLYPNLSMGVIADFVYAPPARVPAFPEMGLPAQSLRFGNASVGFALGMHF
jgi:hypothetical protein